MPDPMYSSMITDLEESQEADYDNREMQRACDRFLNLPDGQWESHVWSSFSGKPKYTFDEANPLVDDVMGEMMAAEFSIRVSPSGNAASRVTANIYEGIIRTIENISNASKIYMNSARIMVGTGADGWRVVQAYRDDDSFQQDLLIQSVPDWQNSVWFDPNAADQTMKDAQFAWVLTSMTKAAYDKLYPEGSGLSVSNDYTYPTYYFKKPDEVIVGEYLYRKKRTRELALMSDGSIYEMDADFDKVQNDLARQKITIVRTRKRQYHDVYSRMFDGGDFLTSPKKTVFNLIPLVPVFGNYRVSEGKPIWWSLTSKIMDPQRVINYAESRKIEEGALAPRGKIWMTKDQAKSDDVRRTLRTLNTNMEPVQFYDFTDNQLPPQYMGAPQSNPGLVETSQSAQAFIARTSGTFDEARGAAPAHRSGEAVGLLQKKADNPKRKWFRAVEIAVEHTARIIMPAIPRVYDTQQEMILTQYDGRQDVVTIRRKVKDQETGEIVELNDLSKGTYDVVCTSGPAFQSRQQETTTTITELAAIDPSILQLGADILLSNMQAPGLDKLAERKRIQMLEAGLIPRSQMTKAEIQAADKKAATTPKESPTDRANLQIAAAQEADVKGKNTERAAKLELEQQKIQLKQLELQLKDQRERDRLAQEEQKILVNAVTEVVTQIKMQSETLKNIREAMGVDAIVGPAPAKAFNTQAKKLAGSIARPTQITQ